MLQIASPFQQIFDTDGSPLDNGYIYIGTANANPEVSPISLWWDDAGTIPAAQPIRTQNGYIVRNGTPARLYTSLDDFSLTVKNRNGVIVLTVLDATADSNLTNALAASSGSSLIGFLQAGANAQARTVQSKLRESVSVLDFGAVGDGATDDTAAIQAAINYVQAFYKPEIYASNSPGPGSAEVFFPFGLYKITAALTATRSISFRGEGHSEYSIGARIIQNTSATDHFQINPIAQGCSVSWDDLTMTANGGGGTGGACINITRTTATCNSVRIRGCTFGTPQSVAIKIQASDDVMIHDNLFDVSASSCIALGTSTASNAVSNCAILGNTFYSIATYGVLAYNVTGLLIEGNRVYPSASKLDTFLDGYNTLPYQIKNVVVSGNNFNGVNCLAKLTGVVGFVFNGNNGVSLGAGAGASLSCLEFTGTCSNINIVGNVLSGSFDTKNFYNDSAATITSANIGDNTFVNTGGTGQAMVCTATSGSIKQNSCTGFVSSSVGEQIYTTGNAISPGVISSLSSSTFTRTISGAKQGDRVNITPSSTTWPAPAGIVVSAFISAANTVSIQYTNVTGSAIGVPAHDFGILVTR